MTVFIPPAVLDEVEAVFDLPMSAGVSQQGFWRRVFRCDASDEVACFADFRPAREAQDAIDAEEYSAAGKSQMLADPFGGIQVDP